MGDVPVLNWILRAEAVSGVRIVADAVSLRHLRAQSRRAVANLGAEDDAGEPLGLLLQNLVELVHPLLGEALRRHPHLKLWMESVQARRLLFQQRHEMPRFGVTGIPAWDEDGVDARQFRQNVSPFFQRELDLLRIP